MKVGRNDPCPCGSGRKYKNCHLKARDDTGVGSLWQRLHQLSSRLPADLMRFARSRYGAELIDEAWREFSLFHEETFDPDSIHLPVFLPWFFYEWEPDPQETLLPQSEVGRFPLVAAYLERRRRYEDPLAVRYLLACRDSAFSFLDVLDIQPGRGFTARDALAGWQGWVIERSGSETLKKGDIIFAKRVFLDEVSVLDGCAPISFPPREKSAVIELRQKILKANPEVTPAVLRDFGLEMLEVYHEIADRLLNPRPPQLSNTDGDPLLFGRVTYEVPSARAAFDALSGLSLGHTDGELLQDAAFDQEGELEQVTIPWLKAGDAKRAWPKTGLGTIRIEGRRVVCEVNSEERARAFRGIAEERLPAGSRHHSTVFDSVEKALQEHRRESPEPPDDDLSQLPEVQALIKQHLRDHYHAWLDMELPALKGQTPRQAVKNGNGREMVEALLLDLEQMAERQPGMDQEIMDELRAGLGLS